MLLSKRHNVVIKETVLLSKRPTVVIKDTILLSKLDGALNPFNHKDYIRAEGNFHERCIVERTIKAEIRPKEQCEKAGSCWENLWIDK